MRKLICHTLLFSLFFLLYFVWPTNKAWAGNSTITDVNPKTVCPAYKGSLTVTLAKKTSDFNAYRVCAYVIQSKLSFLGSFQFACEHGISDNYYAQVIQSTTNILKFNINLGDYNNAVSGDVYQLEVCECLNASCSNYACSGDSSQVPYQVFHLGIDNKGTCVDTTGNNPNGPPPPTIPPPSPPCANTIGANGCSAFNTPFGSWSTDPAGFVQKLFGILLSISGAIAVLIIMISGYKILMSRGDPEKIQGARESLTAAIVGLLFLIFSLVILEIIGVDILKIPGFCSGNCPTGTGTTSPVDAAACNGLALNPDCGLANNSGIFCGNNPACGITGTQGSLYKCTKSGNGYTATKITDCPNQDCLAQTGANIPDQCGSGAIKHYACQKNNGCQPSTCTDSNGVNGCYTVGNCNNSCN